MPCRGRGMDHTGGKASGGVDPDAIERKERSPGMARCVPWMSARSALRADGACVPGRTTR